MSVIRKVIILNRPHQIFGFSLMQWFLLAVGLGLAFWAGINCPPVKVGNLPLGFLVWLMIVILAMVSVKATELKPLHWWRNRLLYSINAMPRIFMPRKEPPVIYPDPHIIDEMRSKDRDVFVDLSNSHRS